MKINIKISLALLLLSTNSVYAKAQDQISEFNTCIDKLTITASQNNISSNTINNTLKKLSYLPEVIELDQKQPEFNQTFAGYYNNFITSKKISKGQELAKIYKPLLDSLEAKYGVPGAYLIAFWGMETNYGGYKGKMQTLDALATLACNERRSEFFTKELIQALKIEDKFKFPMVKMQGSWAGAMGQMQFMPSTYMQYGIDGDNDGVVDLFDSIPDSLSSAAFFLNKLGWTPNQLWGREVFLPKNFKYQKIGQRHKQNISFWNNLGLIRVTGEPIGNIENINAGIYVPSGHSGPIFLGYDNFDIIMKWNKSEFYALCIGILADRIKGGGPLATTIPTQQRFSRNQLLQIQDKLTALGFYGGKVDGLFGSASKQALQDFQEINKLIADGYPSQETIQRLGLKF